MKKFVLLLLICMGIFTTSYAVKPHAKTIKKTNAELMVANPNATGIFNDIKKPGFIHRVKMTAVKIFKKVNPADDDGKLNAILAHLWILWIIAFILNMDAKNEFASFYLRQTLGLYLLGLLLSPIALLSALIPFAGLILIALWLVIVVLLIISLLGALQGQKKLVPLFGKMFQKWFSGI